jgi:hypothetical protein
MAMDTKPFNIQAPESVAKEYGGNKQQIAQAAQMGLIDPTTAVLAGMFIDRMRTAQVQEQQPPQTVAQDVMTPQQPMQPGMEQGMGMPQEMAQGAPQGLPSLPIDPRMFNEQSFAGGGIVAFSQGNLVNSPMGPTDPMAEMIAKMQGYFTLPLSEEEKAYRERLKGAPERAKAAKSDAFNQFLTETGLRMMQSRAPGILAAAGESGAAAAPRLFAGSKEAREIEEAGLKGMAEATRADRAQQMAGVTAGLQQYGQQEDRASRETQSQLDRENRMAIASIPDKTMQVAAQLRKDNPNLSYLDAVSQAAQALSPRDTYNATRNAVSAAAKDANAQFMQRATFDAKLMADMKAAAAGDKAAQQRVDGVRNKIQEDVFKLYQVEGVDLSSGKLGQPSANDPLGIRR